MNVTYVCRHCKTEMGRVPKQAFLEQRLGLHFLTPDERNDIITYNPQGDMTVQLICDYCHEALQANPELLLQANPLQ